MAQFDAARCAGTSSSDVRQAHPFRGNTRGGGKTAARRAITKVTSARYDLILRQGVEMILVIAVALHQQVRSVRRQVPAYIMVALPPPKSNSAASY